MSMTQLETMNKLNKLNVKFQLILDLRNADLRNADLRGANIV